MLTLAQLEGFDWDEGNQFKSLAKHSVTAAEAEQIFFNQPLLTVEDEKHSAAEQRFHALGKTDEARLLHITFTLRRRATLIRIISARDMSRRERQIYDQET